MYSTYYYNYRSTAIKKGLLAGFVVIAFIIYSLQARNEQNGATISAPASLQTGTAPTQQPVGVMPMMPSKNYRDGSFTGDAADAYYGNIQVQVVISGGKVADVVFLQYPNDRGTSVHINAQAMPYLKQEAIQAQSAQIDGVSGATDTSQAFIQSLSSALDRAKA